MTARPDLREVLKYFAILLLILGISAFHYQTSTSSRYLHEIYQRVYYIPILLAAFWYGPLGGILAAAFTSGIYLYHIQRDWSQFPVYTFNQYAEIILYHVVALLIGFLSRKERRQQSELEKTSEQLRSAYQELQNTLEHLRKTDRLAALGELSAGIAHEIRNPLGSIKGSVEILETDYSADHPKREFVNILKEETARLNRIVAEFLKFARPPQPAVNWTSVNDLIDSTFLLVRKQAQQCKVDIVKRLDPAMPAAQVDPDQIRQVLLNIMLNGIQAMPEGGTLEVRSRHDNGNRKLVIEISDTGEGVNDEDLDRIFDPFYTTKPNGTGLGLSIAHQLVENHAGRLRVRRNEQGGLTFQILIPFEGDAA